MAKYEITHACGHRATHEIGGKVAGRQSRADWLAAQDCPDCKAAARKAEHDAANAAAADRAAQAGLPALTGSAKQVAWAESIRAQALDALTDALAKGNPAGFPAAEMAGRIVALETSAAWWIDGRALLVDGMTVIRKIKDGHTEAMAEIMAACKAARG